MSRREAVWLIAAAVLTLLVSFSAPAYPVNTPEEPEGPGQTKEQETAVESILQQQEDLMRGSHFGYDPGARRDPFQSLYEKVEVGAVQRPVGIRGMLIAEISLDGIIEQPNSSAIAFFTGSDNKGYFLRVGDRVFDGTLLAIDSKKGSVTFRQQVDDPRQIKPYRDVVRRLTPTDEESR